MDCGGGCGENLEREGLRVGVEQTRGGFRLLYETRACITICIHMYPSAAVPMHHVPNAALHMPSRR